MRAPLWLSHCGEKGVVRKGCLKRVVPSHSVNYCIARYFVVSVRRGRFVVGILQAVPIAFGGHFAMSTDHPIQRTFLGHRHYPGLIAKSRYRRRSTS
jgi:hypothetical protein